MKPIETVDDVLDFLRERLQTRGGSVPDENLHPTVWYIKQELATVISDIERRRPRQVVRDADG